MDASLRRILALQLPQLSTDRLKRRWKASRRLDNRPLVIADKKDNALRLTAVDERAAKLGLYAGQALADARAMVPAIAVLKADAPADTKLLDQIANWCTRFTPLVALDPPHDLLLDITGCSHLFGTESAMVSTIATAVTAQGFTVRMALAGTAEAARALACCRNGFIVAPGQETEAVAALPVDVLRCDPLVLHALRRAGLKTVGQVTERGRGELASRFGNGFVSLLERTLGRYGSPITPRLPLADLMAEHRFAEPVTTQTVITSTLQSLTASLSAMLEKRSQGARRWHADFFRADGYIRRLTVETGQAVRAADIVVRLFGEKLDSLADPLDPGFGFDLIRLSAALAQEVTAAAVSLDADTARQDVEHLVDCLAARFGAQRVRRFEAQNTHIPEAASVLVPAQQMTPTAWIRPAIPRPLRLFARPEPIDMVAEIPEGPPLRFRWRHMLHAIVRSEGPERIAMEWWKQQGPQYTRDYYRVQDAQGHRYWLYRNGLMRETAAPTWFLHGVFA